MGTIRFLPDGTDVRIEAGETVLAASLRAGNPHAHLCGGEGRCSTCRVALVEGAEGTGPRTPAEQEIAARLHFPAAIRLACQLRIDGDAVVRRLVLDAEDVDLASQLSPIGVGSTVGEETAHAIVFTDLRDFTSLSESIPPYDVMHVLERHFVAMSRVVSARGGVVNNTMGDGMLILFHGEEPVRACEKAVRASLEMLRAQAEQSAHVRALFGRGLEMGIGVHFGELLVGSLRCGTERRRTVIGDAVNFASRIEQANKVLGTRLLVSDAVARHLEGRLAFGREAELPLHGKKGTHPLHEVLSLDGVG